MSIRSKITVLVLALFTLSAGVDFFIQKFIIYPSFVRLEQHEAGENIRRIVGAIDREIFHLDKLCNDWAMWNESYRFIQTLDEDFIQDNLVGDAFAANKVNLICYLRHDGTMIWGQAYDLETVSPLPVSFLKDQKLPATHPMVELRAGPTGDAARVRKGAIMTDRGPMIFASHPILRTDGSGPSRGVLAMGRLLTETVVASLARQTRIEFSIDYPLSAKTIRQETLARTAYREQDLTYYAKRQRHHIDVWTVYKDPRGDPAFSITYRQPRQITRQGMISIRYALTIGVGMALTILAILVFFLQSVVVRPIKQLTDHASRLDYEGNYSVRLNLCRRDEIGQLARVLDFAAVTIA